MIFKIAQTLNEGGDIAWHYFSGFDDFTHGPEGDRGATDVTECYIVDHNFDGGGYVQHVSFGGRRLGFACLAYLCNDRGETIQRIDGRNISTPD